MTDPVEALAQRVAERVIDLIVGALDIDALVARVDVNAVGERVDVGAILATVDVNALLSQVDVDAVLERVSVDELLRRVDMGALLARVDVNELVARIDTDALVRQTDLGAILARSSGGVASEMLDAARSQAVGLDQFIDRWVARLLRRRRPAPLAPPGPPEAWAERASDRAAMHARANPDGRSAQGHYAGAVSRFLTYVTDLAVITGLFTLGLEAISFAVKVVTGHSVAWNRSDIVVTIVFAAWWLLYFGYSWAVSGRTFGMAVFGVRLVRADGMSLRPGRALLRALVFPLSFAVFGLGFLGILVQREHRALHDLIAGSAVIYAWNARAARLRFLAREAEVSEDRRPRRPGSPAHVGRDQAKGA